jgi:tRNA-2-methylthio-N6-dimethylallyladenosine synthase
LLREQQEAFNASKVGQIVDVLFTHPGRRDGQIGGRTPWLQPVHVNGPERLIGQIVPVRIAHAQPASLQGILAATLEPEIAVA